MKLASLVALLVKNPPASSGDEKDLGSVTGLGWPPGVGNGNSLQLFLPGVSHAQRSLAGHSPQGCNNSDTTEHTHTITTQYMMEILVLTLIRTAF